MPTSYPHRAAFLAAKLGLAAEPGNVGTFFRRLLSVVVFDHFLRHPNISLGDEDDRIVDADGVALDIDHPRIEESIDALFRIARRNEALWFEISGGGHAHTVVLRSRVPNGIVDVWDAAADLSLSGQLSQCLAKWLTARRLPSVAPLSEFSFDDMRNAADRLARASTMLSLRDDYTQVPPQLLASLPRLASPYLRVLAELSGGAAHTVEAKILEIEPGHPVVRRKAYVRGLTQGSVDRRDILPLVAEAPMYAKPHLSIWGEAFAADRPLENMGVRHQGIAAQLLPANPFACHNYSLQLAEVGRREESYRWADRATVAGPDFSAAHLDCVRRMRHVGRPAQAFAEAQYRCREILDHAATATLPTNDWQAPHHAALLIAFAHLDIGRLAEAIELADKAMAELATDDATREAFAWAFRRIADWKRDTGVFARAYACEAYHRGDPGRALVGLGHTRIGDEEDAMMAIDALLTIGREDEAEIAVYHAAGLDGHGVLGDGKARLAAARALITAGRLDEALEHIQIVQLRRGQGRHEAEINRLFRLAAIHPGAAWDRVIARRWELGARTLAQLAARDLADFVPGMDTQNVRRVLGDSAEIAFDPRWISELIAALPAAQATAPAIVHRLTRPADDSLAAADRLAEDWWTVLVAPTTDRGAHAATAVLAFGVAFARYMTEASHVLSPIAGAYRHIATEALHLVRQSRYHIDATSFRALLSLVEQLSAAPDWMLDMWLLRIERAFDAEAEYGAHLDNLVVGLPSVARHLRGDDRIGWETRAAHDLAADPSQYDAAAKWFERSTRAVETGALALAWSVAAARAQPEHAHLDIHWLAATANPNGVAAPWLSLAAGLLISGHSSEGFAVACRGMIAATANERAQAVQDLSEPWRLAGVATPIDGDRAFEVGLAAASEGSHDLAVQHLRWAAAMEPTNAKRAHHLAVLHLRGGQYLEAVNVLAAHERGNAPRVAGRLLVDAGQFRDALPMLRYASRWSATAEDFALLVTTAHRAGNHAIAAAAGKRALRMTSLAPEVSMALATSLYHVGAFAECEEMAQRLLELATAPTPVYVVARLAMARALIGQHRYGEALAHAQEASALDPSEDAANDLIDVMGCIVAQRTPPIEASSETSPDRQAFANLEAGNFDSIAREITNPSWPIARAALAACDFRSEIENAIPVSPRALEAAIAVLGRSRGSTQHDAVLARIQAMRIRENAYIQIDPPPPLGQRYTPEEFDREFRDRDQRPRRPSGLLRFAR